MGESFMRKWVWRLCVALWVAISTPVVLSFLLVLILPMLNAHPLSYFERRDPILQFLEFVRRFRYGHDSSPRVDLTPL